MNHAFVDTIFNCINFIARVSIVLYLIKKYIAPKIINAITYEQESIKIVERQHDDMKIQCDEVDKEIKAQEQWYFDLENKFQIWQASLVREQQEYDRHCKEYEQKLVYQFEKKQQYVKRQQLIQQEFPVLFKNIQKDIQEAIKKDPELGKKYLKNLLDATQGKML